MVFYLHFTGFVFAHANHWITEFTRSNVSINYPQKGNRKIQGLLILIVYLN